MIEPGSTIGMLGSGQLGRMFVHAAQRMGYCVHVFSPGEDTPAGQAANLEVSADYDDHEAARKFAQHVDVVTLEFENIPVATVDAIAEVTPVHPGSDVLQIAQNRIREKSSIRELGLPVPDFAVVESKDDIARFLKRHAEFGAVLKSAEAGYDGKGQARVTVESDPAAALNSIGTTEAIIEEFVPFDFELSVISARSASGEINSYEPIENAHHNHILDVSVTPSPRITARLRTEVLEITNSLMESLKVVGVLCVEFFHAEDGRILINEIAPRPHNSGHLTIESAVTSQFEQQVRAVCDLPLGSTEQLQPAAMANLLGQHLPGESPGGYQCLFEFPTAKLHLYGKPGTRANRKMGHITVVDQAAEAARAIACEARNALAVDAANDSRRG